MKQKYKVFLNDRLIEICAPEDAGKNNMSTDFQENFTVEAIEKWFAGFVAGDSPAVFLTHPEPGLLFQLFRSVFIEAPAAGGVVLQNNRLLFIFRNGKWDLPKGKSEGNPAETRCASSEECGISVIRLLNRCPQPGTSMFRNIRTKGKWIFKETSWFEMKYEKGGKLSPQQEEGITRLKWFLPGELNEALANTYENL